MFCWSPPLIRSKASINSGVQLHSHLLRSKKDWREHSLQSWPGKISFDSTSMIDTVHIFQFTESASSIPKISLIDFRLIWSWNTFISHKKVEMGFVLVLQSYSLRDNVFQNHIKWCPIKLFFGILDVLNEHNKLNCLDHWLEIVKKIYGLRLERVFSLYLTFQIGIQKKLIFQQTLPLPIKFWWTNFILQS